MIYFDIYSLLRSCNVLIFKGFVCGFMFDLCMWGNFYFLFTFLNNYYMSNYFFELKFGILFKVFVFIVIWKYVIGVIKCFIFFFELFI